MPSTSKAQQRAAAIALEAKEGKRPMSGMMGASKSMAKMETAELKAFASTPRKGLPARKK